MSEPRYRLTQSANGSWWVEVRRWYGWRALTVRSPLERAVEWLRQNAPGAFLATALLLTPSLAMGQQQQQAACGPRAQVLKAIAEQFNEKPVARGVTMSGMLLEVFASEGGATFTILVTSPQGRSCLAVSGEAWEFIFQGPEERKS